MGDRLPTRVVLVTEVDFWNGGAGHRARILALVRYLAARLQLSVVLPTPIDDLQRARCEVACPGLELTSLALPARVTMAQARALIADSIAAKRFGTPKEFGDACAYLCSEQAGFISGQNLQIDGGSYHGLI